MPVWLLVAIICVGLLLIGGVIEWRLKRKKQKISPNHSPCSSLDQGFDTRDRDDFIP